MKKEPHGNAPIVAIDLGSSGVTVMAAADAIGEPVQVLAVQGSNRFSKQKAIEHGVVKDVTHAAFMLNEAINLLGNRLGGISLSKAYLILSGRSVQMTHVSGEITQIVNRPVTQSEISEIEQVCRDKIYKKTEGKMQVVDLQPLYYELDGVRIEGSLEPGHSAVNIVGYYAAYVASSEMLDNLQKAVKRSSISEIESIFVGMDCQITALLNEDDNEQGVAIIDMGADTTSYCICHKSVPVAGRTYLFGGNDITRAIQELGMSETMAERLKMHACLHPMASMVPENKQMRLRSAQTGDDVVIGQKDLAATVEKVLNKTLATIVNEINKKKASVQKIYLTGGAAKLNDVCEFIQSKTDIPVDFGDYSEWMDKQLPDEYFMPEYSALVGAICQGQRHREDNRNNVPETKKGTKKKSKKTDAIIGNILDLFSTQYE